LGHTALRGELFFWWSVGAVRQVQRGDEKRGLSKGKKRTGKQLTRGAKRWTIGNQDSSLVLGGGKPLETVKINAEGRRCPWG